MKLAFTTAVAAALTLALAGPAQADSCANAQYRTGRSAALPDCRAYEQISPVDKAGNDVVSTAPTISLGDRVLFTSGGAFAGAESLPLDATYMATRGSEWTTRGTDAKLDGASGIQVDTFSVSDDGTKAAVVSNRALAAGAIEGGSNIYIRDLTKPQSYRLVAASSDRGLGEALTDVFLTADWLGANSDLSAVAFVSPVPLVPGGPTGDRSNLYLYLWHNGNLSLVSRLPDGTPTTIQPGFAIGRLPNSSLAKRFHAVSEDGTRVRWSPGGNSGQIAALYEFVEGQGSTLISRRQGQNASNDPVVVSNHIASADGRTITFSASGPLTDGAQNQGFYRWSADAPANAPLTKLLDTNGQLEEVSPDGRYVWYRDQEFLDDPPMAATGTLRVLDTTTGQTRRFAVLGRELSGADNQRLSPDGHRILFRSYSPVTGVDNANPACQDVGTNQAGFCANLFTYNADTPAEPVKCVSCTTASQISGGASFDRGGLWLDGRDSRAIFDDGRIFFDSKDRLLAADTDTKTDVYEYVPGAGLSLLTPGTDTGDATFRDTSPDGKDVLFTSADQLVPQDSDNLADVYTARVGGGLASQQVAPVDAATAGCLSEACRPGSAVQPVRPAPASSGLGRSRKATVARFSAARLSTATLRAAGRSGRLSLPVKVNRAGRVSATLRGRIAGRTRTAGSATARASKAGTVRLTLRLSKAARAALRRTGRLRLTLTVRFSEADRASSRTVLFTTGRTPSKAKGGAR